MNHFFAYLNRMKYIRRWSLMHSTTEENIMEHSTIVAMLAHNLALVGNTYFGKHYNAERAAVLGLFHESAEVVTGDLPTPIKYYNPQINEAYKELEAVAEQKLLSMLPQELQPLYAPLVSADRTTEEYRLMKYADKLAAYLKCVEEIKVGNSEFARAKEALERDLKGFASPEVNYFLQHFAEGYRLTLDELV